jgi:hypothetical protein
MPGGDCPDQTKKILVPCKNKPTRRTHSIHGPEIPQRGREEGSGLRVGNGPKFGFLEPKKVGTAQTNVSRNISTLVIAPEPTNVPGGDTK